MPTINLPVKGEADWDVKLSAAINTINGAVTAQGDSLPEDIQDGIASTLVAGTNVTLTYDDVAGTLTISAAGGGGGGVTLPINQSDVTGLVSALAGKQPTGDYATNTALTTGLAGKQASGDYATNGALTSGLAGKANTSHTHTASQVTDFAEAAQDATAALLVAGSNITLSYDDVANTLTIASSTGGGGVTLPINQSDVTGLVSALAGKQATGDYATNSALTSGLSGKANTSHTHAISDVTNLQTTLDGKQASGSYATSSDLTAGLAGKANTAHTHAISDVTNLQTTLDGKQAAGSYAPLSHTHQPAEVIGLQAAFTDIATSLAGKADTSAVAAKWTRWTGTQAAYDAVTPKDPNTLYVVIP